MRRPYQFLALLSLVVVLGLSLSCAGLLRDRSSRATPIPQNILREPTVATYVNRVAHDLLRQESVEQLGVPTVDVRILETSRIQGDSDFIAPTIRITRGMLNMLTSEAELACLLGHEIGHKVLHRKEWSPPRGQRESEVARAQWNQRREQEADEYGATLCHKAGYDPYALVAFMERMARFQPHDLFTALDELTATHKDFRNRSRDLKKYLTKTHVALGAGVRKEREYVRSLATLRNIQTADVVHEVLPGGPKLALEKVSAIEAELKGYTQRHQPVPFPRFVTIMTELSWTIELYGMEPSSFFMKEELSQNSPLWANEGLRKKIEDVLAILGRLGVGALPVVGDAVDFYEFVIGKEFGTGRELSLAIRHTNSEHTGLESRPQDHCNR